MNSTFKFPFLLRGKASFLELFEYAFNFQSISGSDLYKFDDYLWKFSDLPEFTIHTVVRIKDYPAGAYGNELIGNVGGFQLTLSDYAEGSKLVLSPKAGEKDVFTVLPKNEWLWVSAYYKQATPANNKVYVNGVEQVRSSSSVVSSIPSTADDLRIGKTEYWWASDYDCACIAVFNGNETQNLNDLYNTKGIVYPDSIILANTPDLMFMAKDNDPTGSGIFRYGDDGGNWLNMDSSDKFSVAF